VSFEREERELAQLRDALQQALQDKAVAERVQVQFTHGCMYSHNELNRYLFRSKSESSPGFGIQALQSCGRANMYIYIYTYIYIYIYCRCGVFICVGMNLIN